MAAILLVADNDDHAALTHAALADFHQMPRIERAVSTDECLAMLNDRSYDAIVLDCELTGRSGVTSLQEVMDAAHGVPVIIMTNPGEEETAIGAMKNGAYDFILRSDDHLMKLPLVLQRAMEAHKAATEKAKLQTRMEELGRSRAFGRMASGIAHDLNNALATILGQTELMLMDPGDREEVARGLQIILKAAQGGADAVVGIQELTKINRQQELARLSVNDVVRDALRMTEPRWISEAQKDGIKIDISTELNSLLTIAGNALELKEVLINMIFNSVEAMPDGGTLSIKTYDANDSVCISISDTGLGIAPGIVDSIFDPFFTTRGAEYAGLGLSLARAIVGRHEGEIHVDSVDGEGTTFVIRLPASMEPTQEQEVAVTSLESRRANVLVIDDEDVIRDLLENILSRNHNVTTVADGATGMKGLENGDYDIIFTDLGMPEMSGWEVAEQAKAIDPGVKIVIITGWGIELGKDELEERKVDSIITKPFRVSEILDVVAETLGARAQ
jgi:signal transduction histidine kinase